MQSFYTNIKFI